jgi:hypothetical protein
LYAYAHNNPITFGDPDGHSVASLILNVSSAVFSLVFAVNPATGGFKLAFAMTLGSASMLVTGYDYAISLKDLKNELKAHQISQATYNADINTCNRWLAVEIAVGVVTMVFTYLGLPKYDTLMSKTGMSVIGALVTVLLGYTLSNVAWLNDMLTLMEGKVQWF